MRYCENCGAQVEEAACFCTHCGAPTKGRAAAPPRNEGAECPYPPRGRDGYDRYYEEPRDYRDSGNAGFGILGFFLPLVGLILFLVWQDIYPYRAKSAGIGALVAVGVGAALVFLIFILGSGLLSWLR